MERRDFEQQAREILENAAAAVGRGDWDLALPRLVDAAGAVAMLAAPGAFGGPGNPTPWGWELRDTAREMGLRREARRLADISREIVERTANNGT